MAGFLFHTTVYHILWLGLPNLSCLNISTHIFNTHSMYSRISTLACLSKCLHIRGKCFLLIVAVMPLALERPGGKQARRGCL